jgi:hypothetical protein
MRRLWLLILMAALAGCSSTGTIQDSVTKDEMLPYALEIDYGSNAINRDWTMAFETALNARLQAVGMLASGEESGNTATINFTTFRMRSTGTRVAAGIFAGTDEVICSVKVIDRNSGRVVGESEIKTSNVTAWGTSEGYLKDHAEKVADFLLGIQE